MIAGIIFWLPVWIMAIAIAEWFIHRVFEHNRFPGLGSIYHEHHVGHHNQQRNLPVYRHIDTPVWIHLLIASPILLVYAYRGFVMGIEFAQAGLLVAVGVLVVHAWVWSLVHRNIHKTERNWTRHLPGYAMVERHHHNHHRDYRTNLCVLFGVYLGIDRVFRTQYKRKVRERV